VRVKAAHEVVLKPRVYKSAVEFAPLGVPYDLYATVARGQGAALRTSARLATDPLIAPLAAGRPVGELAVTDPAGELIARAPLAPLADVPLGSVWTRALDGVALLFH
jgi:D-alanyl-D-alanine carboxypeptidase